MRRSPRSSVPPDRRARPLHPDHARLARAFFVSRPGRGRPGPLKPRLTTPRFRRRCPQFERRNLPLVTGWGPSVRRSRPEGPAPEGIIPEGYTTMATAISSGVRSSLASLQTITSQAAAVQNRLATGKKVNSAIDSPVNFFTAAVAERAVPDAADRPARRHLQRYPDHPGRLQGHRRHHQAGRLRCSRPSSRPRPTRLRTARPRPARRWPPPPKRHVTSQEPQGHRARQVGRRYDRRQRSRRRYRRCGHRHQLG